MSEIIASVGLIRLDQFFLLGLIAFAGSILGGISSFGAGLIVTPVPHAGGRCQGCSARDVDLHDAGQFLAHMGLSAPSRLDDRREDHAAGLSLRDRRHAAPQLSAAGRTGFAR
jgi:hypothetical protein